MRAPRLVVGALALLAAACGEDPPEQVGSADAAPPAPDAAGDAAPPEWQSLVTAAWNLEANTEGYFCGSRTVTEDIYVGAVRANDPLGTHHAVVSVGAPSSPDTPGVMCGVGFGGFFASGVGTPELVLPPGIALVVRAGQQVVLNTHVFNPGDTPLSGLSGVEVQGREAGEVEHIARMDMFGPLGFSIPSSGMPYTLEYEQAAQVGRTAFGLYPHMHQLGTHFKLEVVRGAETLTLWDGDFDFETQASFQLIEPFVFVEGDQLRVPCTWVNTTGTNIEWGPSFAAEMCYAMLMSY
jgi:hypothetical protein